MADKTTVEKRGGGMSLLISVAGLGAVAGPLLGNLFAKANLKILIFTFDKFSFPFLISSVLSILASVVLFFILSEPSTNYFPEISPAKAIGKRNAFTFLKVVNKSFVIWLLFSFISEFSLAMFEGTFALHSQRLFEFNAKQMSLAFIVCGSVMGLLQLGPVPWLIKKKGEAALLPYGLMILGIGMTLLMASKKIEFILLFVAMVAMAMAILTPSLASLITKNSTQNYGTALGIFSSVNSLGQVLGVVTGSVMMIWFNHLPYFLVSIFLFVAAGLSLPALQNKILMRNKPLLETTGRK
jgi:DHA1 family multidrug resistance protein-like MFS transporter